MRISRPLVPLVLLTLLITGLSLGVASLASAQTVLFGPQQYTRTAGPPNQFTATFPVPAGATAPYTLHLVNGHADGTKRISSATVTLNEGRRMGSGVVS